MKNLKKIFAIAMSVATVAMSTSAFADEIAAAYDAENKVVAFTEADAATILNGIDPDDQMTVVVVPSNFGETDDDKIYYINQDAASGFATIITAMGVKDGFETEDIGDATWQVRIGGESITATPYAVKFEEEGPVFELGNVDGNYDDEGNAIINGSDAVYVLKQFAGTVGDTCPHPAGWDAFIASANVDGNFDESNEPIVNGSDAVYILKAFAGTLEDGFPAAK